MLGHQSQKPFRTVSKMIVGSIQRLNDVIRPGFPPDTKMFAITRNRFSMFRRRGNKKKNLLKSSSVDEDSDGSISSLPDLRNVVSLGSSESDSTIFLQRKSPASPIGGMAGDVAPEILLFPDNSITGVKTTNSGEDDDLRWLFARQQLPPSTAAQFSPSFKEELVP
jgi:hypothetical protein